MRKFGSQYGAFAYTYPVDGLVHLRLNFASEAELKAVAPGAWLTPKGHRAYGVAIRIVDDATLKEALELARLAYDAT